MRFPARRLQAPALFLFCLVATCGTIIAPRNGWNERWGPLVPHKSFPGDCNLCHVPERWDVMRDEFQFDHEKETGVALRGAHAKAACLRCHNDFGPVGAYSSRGCGGCHLDPHEQQLGADCSICHEEENWRPQGIIAEHARNGFPLVGRHAVVTCDLCHRNAPTGDYKGAPRACEACHGADLARATSPDHAANGWTADCERCHSPTAWDLAGFRHSGFPLTGAHSSLQCTDCHLGGNFTTLPVDCYSCHQNDYEGTTFHAAANFSHDCRQCHSTSRWTPSNFQHTWPLTGKHATTDCLLCHVGSNFTSTPTDCWSCHSDDFGNGPNHVTGNFSHECQTCHTTNSWEGAVFNHAFPLTGGHANLECTRCHVGGNYTSTPNDCYSCHTDDYQRGPNHVSANFSHDCTICHRGTTTWTGAVFNHRFPLSGPHNVSCGECHTGGNTAVVNCLGCHLRGVTDGHHDEVRDYSYDSASCVRCHPTGRGGD